MPLAKIDVLEGRYDQSRIAKISTAILRIPIIISSCTSSIVWVQAAALSIPAQAAALGWARAGA
jgi:hypothetical protein